MTTKYIETTVEVDLDDFETDDLIEAIEDRGLGMVRFESLLRHGIEDRDWSKIEEFAEKLNVRFSKMLVLRNKHD